MNNQELKQEFKERINHLLREFKKRPRDNNDNVEVDTEDLVFLVNIETLKKFAIDRNFEGEKPQWIVSSPYKMPDTDVTVVEDRYLIPTNEPKNHQIMFEMLKKYELVREGSQIEDYGFLFSNVDGN